MVPFVLFRLSDSLFRAWPWPPTLLLSCALPSPPLLQSLPLSSVSCSSCPSICHHVISVCCPEPMKSHSPFLSFSTGLIGQFLSHPCPTFVSPMGIGRFTSPQLPACVFLVLDWRYVGVMDLTALILCVADGCAILSTAG
jgi:hypothetical protein